MIATAAKRVFDWKIRGVRWIEIIGALVVAALIAGVYVAKAAAAREASRIAELEREIGDNRQRVRLLRAEVARLEQPARLETLSRGIGMAPVNVKQQADEARLPTLARPPAPTQRVLVDPTPAPVPSAPSPAEAEGAQ
ncbi:cell division protein [Brevundimonas sp. Leaf363]|uniref:cell division protein FtsL n=1 Tax=Brevundimonas sp. Leaf363 TaxID=1736353 RepID=UPI0006F38C8A|nr:hypothetical protein [Brevundimonas sp. Leaf363]KQS55495.1 cell division protein [Brevundimonas sp. Leaf363]